jgi:MFS family permease
MLHLGRHFSLFIVGRILQGVSSAVVWIVGLALIADTVRTDDIGHAMGYVFLAMSLGLLLGPLLGGIVYEKLGYNAVFIMAYILIAIDILLRLVAIEKKAAHQWLHTGTDTTRDVELTESAEAERPIESMVEQNMNSGTKRVPSFMVLLHSASFLASLWGSVVLAILMTSFDAVLPLYVKETFNWTSLGAGER